jgi:outer membrane autotransporter protein
MAALMNTSSHGALTAGTINANGADLKVTTIASAGRYVVVQGEGYDTFNEVQVENSLFHHDEVRDAATKSLIITTFGKTADDISGEFGTDENTSNILAELAGNASENEKVQEIISGIGTTTGDALNKELKKLSPTTAPITTGIATTVTRHIANAIAGQLEDVRVGRSGGEEEADVDMWVKVLASHADQGTSRTTDGFEGNTKGVAFGVDIKRDNTVVGFGYANTTSDVKSIGRRIDVEGHNLFAYAEYQPSEWYVRGLLNYGMSAYEEKKSVFGARVDAEYDVTAISGEMTVGHEYGNGVTPFGGLRFLHIAQDSYTDNAGVRVNTDDVDIWTAVAGAKYSRDIVKGDKTYRPEVHAGLTYDLLSDTTDANVKVGDYGYIVETRRLPKFGIEAGFGLGIKVCDHIDVNFTYDANLRKDYTVHSGNVKLQYNF